MTLFINVILKSDWFWIKILVVISYLLWIKKIIMKKSFRYKFLNHEGNGGVGKANKCNFLINKFMKPEGNGFLNIMYKKRAPPQP